MLAGLDLGTSGSKIVVYDTNGALVDKFYCPYKTNRANSENEIDGVELINAVKSLVQQACSKYQIDAIGVDSFGEAFVMLDENDVALANIMLMTDYRGEEEAKYLRSKLGEKHIEEITGIKCHQMYSLPKIMWIKKNYPDLFKKVEKILLMEDYVVYSLTGERYIDYTLATRTLAFDINVLDFSKEILDVAGISRDLFSKPAPVGYKCGTITNKLCAELGINNKVIVTLAGHDQVAVGLGSGVLFKGQAVDGAGTVECITPVFDKSANFPGLIENNYAIVPYLNKGEYVTYAFSYTSGSLIDWFMNTFAKDLGKNAFVELEKGFVDGPTGLLVLPHFAGAATPYMDGNAKGAIVGLTLESTLSNIYQGVLEGIAYEMRINAETIRKDGIKVDRLVATGGGALSRKWLQIKADILNLPIDILSDNQSGTRGSAMAAGIAVGIFKDKDEAAKVMIQKVGEVLPNKENHQRYMEYYKKYEKLYSALKGVYENK